MIEWYGFFIYATAASLVFATLFFKLAGPQFGILLSFASVGIRFVFRPLGGLLAGHFGDRLGRRKMLVITLLLMGSSTVLVGLLPSYATLGVAAPVLLLVLRIMQGVSAGGEWGGAALMAVEHARPSRRGVMGSLPQLGVPLGLLLASAVTALVAAIAPGDALLVWGWRVPFLFSVVLVVLGYFVRRAVDESPVFVEMVEKKQRQKAPIPMFFKHHGVLLLLAVLVFAGNSAAGYLTTGGFVTNYVTSPDSGTGIDRSTVLNVLTLAALFYLASTLLGGHLADRIGRRRTMLIGFVVQLVLTFPFFWLISDGGVVLLATGVFLWYLANGITYGPLAAWYAELFPATVRYTGASLAYAFGAVLGGAFAPTISTALTQGYGIDAVAAYIVAVTVVAIVSTLLLRDRPGIALGVEAAPEQVRGGTVFDRKPVAP